MPDRDVVEGLIEKGRSYLESEDYDAAIMVGREIEQQGHSYAFELIAFAQAAKDDFSEAVATLEHGVATWPAAWPLWQLLGNFYSELSEYASAQHAYTRALECPNANHSSINYNAAVALLREDKLPEALHRCNMVTSDEMQIEKAALLTHIHTAQGDTDAAMRCAEQALATTVGDEDDLTEEENRNTALIYSGYAEAVWKSGDATKALELAWHAVSLWKQHEEAMWLIREIENGRSDRARRYALMLEGVWPQSPGEDEPTQGFYVNYAVIADNEEEAFRLAARFEPEGMRESLRVAECEASKEHDMNLVGVYDISNYFCFPLEESE
jgi:tetratricopeptide (TPR) repeat protein